MPEQPSGIAPDYQSYNDAVTELAHALVWVWTVCESLSTDADSPIRSGANLPEALSYALGEAAVILGLDRDDDGSPLEGTGAWEAAGDGLVRHRPGSWEAGHVRPLTFAPDLIPHPDPAESTGEPS
jgi:hypothetical protein